MSIEQEIGKHLKRIVTGNEDADMKSRPVMMGTVVAGSQDGVEMTVKVILSNGSADSAVPAMLNVYNTNTMGVVIMPTDEAKVWVAEIDGPGKWAVIKASEAMMVRIMTTNEDGTSTVRVTGTETRIENEGNTVVVGGGKVEINGGANGGMVNVVGLVSRMNNVEAVVDNLVSAYNSHVHPDPVSGVTGATAFFAGMVGTTVRADVEDTNCTH